MVTQTQVQAKPLLNDEQESAIKEILTWMEDPSEPFFVLEGSAGTGKTFCIRELPNRMKGRIVYTAPTNKATKELAKSVTTADYRPECRTIYSLLGLTLEANGEVKELKAPEDPIDLSHFRLIVVDEGSMVNENLRKFIKLTNSQYGVKFLFMGDPAQLPPVGELRSPIWLIKKKARLETVMRHDNQILTLATKLRQVVDHPAPSIKLLDDHDDVGGVYTCSAAELRHAIADAADQGMFSEPDKAKAIAWRNATVDSLNALVRSVVFNNPTDIWLPTDRVIFTSPAKDLDDEVIATTDDEGVINHVDTEYHAIYGDFKIFRISITLDRGPSVVARVLHPDSQFRYAQRLDELSAQARVNKRMWRQFWEFKDAFHALRHAYALTAHRAQGSTYDTAFVDYRDILVNRNRSEAYRCLYVACTRPKRALILG